MLLGPGRKDESGDFTSGAELDSAAIARVLAFTAARKATNAETIAALEQTAEGSQRGLEGVSELRDIAAFALAGSLNWISHWYRADDSLRPDEIADRFLSVFEQGLEPRG